jgi:outer membrane protein OmpA-like peptidoglycan-associated protein
LGIGIAQAQKKLDDNSIKQAIALADPENGFGGKSLLELGFIPAFYSFSYADISAEIELKMRLSTGFEIGGELNVDFTKQGGYSKDKLDYLREDRESKHREEFKSSRGFLTTADNFEELTINSVEVQMNDAVGVINRLEDFGQDIRQVSTVDRASLEVDSAKYKATNISTSNNATIVNSGGYIVVSLPVATATDQGVLAVSEYVGAADVDLNGAGDDFTPTTDFATTFPLADTENGAGTVTGFNAAENKYYSDAATSTEIEVYFDFDKHDVRLAIDATYNDAANGVNKDNTVMKPILLKLAKILDKDPNARVTIKGYTDGSGSKPYNKLLSEKRAQSLMDWLVENGADAGRITPKGFGEDLAGGSSDPNLTYRKAVIEITSDADYFWFEGGALDHATAASTQPENPFIYLDGAITPAGDYDIVFTSSGQLISLTGGAVTSLADIQNAAVVQDHFSSQIIDNSIYLMHNESKLRYTVYSNQQEEIQFQTGSNSSETFEDSESKYLIDETTNTSTRIKRDSENISNPSAVAVGVSVDARYSRQFSIDVSGNARVAARIVAVPAPEQFTTGISDIYNQ